MTRSRCESIQLPTRSAHADSPRASNLRRRCDSRWGVLCLFDFCDESARPTARKPGSRGHAANQCRRSESDVLWCVFWHSIAGRWLRRRVVLPVDPAAIAVTACCRPALHRGHALRHHRIQCTRERTACAPGQRITGGFRILAGVRCRVVYLESRSNCSIGRVGGVQRRGFGILPTLKSAADDAEHCT
jgi:hypothetical protein